MLALRAALEANSGQLCGDSIVRALCQLTVRDLGQYISAVPPFPQEGGSSTAPSSVVTAFSLHDLLHFPGPTIWNSSSLGKRRVGCATLYETDSVHVSWFLMSPGSMLPLHDHCLMVVWQRMLFGSIRVTSMDWREKPLSAEDAIRKQREGGEAAIVSSSVVTAQREPCDPSSVTSFGPTEGGVLHEIVNESDGPALFLDVIAPPYHSPPDYFDCGYYKASFSHGEVAGGVAHLTPCAYDCPPMVEFFPLESLRHGA
ncbi:hypothetical protein, conserved [Trypanosoma brucei gambiense DAL972]|uniref:Cysteine dioxygenase n=2 Tax=Trypanosoma brucei TaxID=5691 RepID=C9ZTQ1_TRYB9|nr:hypothetical protein, conserved [Trypanosoma brucei gambiense DAL972]RHW71579.1 hypothetical protein DPX39_070069100 [Trypanosoma brucei equiperdum]CBH12786.1 hypothetical protein, conserved [Trypanosoma brucei gambiense DAL972]|eukprot:XP_011775066.1 hypothetical protein, conserved [Trypanosoma brucei gambiense DAL972]